MVCVLGCQVRGVPHLGGRCRGWLHPSSLQKVTHSLNLGLDFSIQPVQECLFRKRITK